jgi:hypothetical protein
MENHLLIYGKEYDLWREGKYIGSAFYVDDENIGDCFQKENYYGEIEVFIADEWKFKN